MTNQPATDEPVKTVIQPIDLSSPEWYLNRELTWLEFNKRVLWEAEDERTPLLERVKFIAIVSANLDEFFMKRIGGLKQQVGALSVNSASMDAAHSNKSPNATRWCVRLRQKKEPYSHK